MRAKSNGKVTLVINTAQRETYDRFNKEKDTLIKGDVRLYDTAHVYPERKEIKPLKNGIFSYLKIFRQEKPGSIVLTYDGSMSGYFYFKIGLFILIALILGRRVNYYSAKGTYADFFPLDWAFTPFFLLRNTPHIFKAYIHCFLSREKRGRVMGFNKSSAPLTFWYESAGKKQLQYGCWGYCAKDEFGDSQREKFYHHYLSYGYLLNKLGFRRYYGLAAMLYLASFVTVFAVSGKWMFGIILLLLLLLSPYYTFSFLSYTKPENIAWFLAIPAFYCASGSLFILLAVLLLVSTYLSFTVFFFISVGVIALFCNQSNPMFLLVFVPAGIKLSVDFYFVARHNFHSELLHIISGKGGEKRSVSHRRYGIQYIPPQYLALGMISVILLILQLLLHMCSWPVTIMFILLLSINFLFVRIADAPSFYRLFLSMILFSLLSTTSIFFLIAGAFILLVNPKWVDDHKDIAKQNSSEIYPPVEKIVWTREQDKSLEEYIGKVKPGSRILFEYTGHVALSPFRNILSILEAKLFDNDVELLPHELTFYINPQFSYDWSSHLSPNGNLDTVDKLLESCSISYVMVFSEDLLNNLLVRGYQLLSEFKLDNLRGFVHETRIPAEAICLLYCGTDYNFCIDSSAILEHHPNRMILKGVKEGQKYVIHYTYHKDWQAYQNTQRLLITPTEVYGLKFMQVKAKDSQDILFRFGKLNYIVR